MEQVAEGVYQVKQGFRAFIVDGDAGVTLIDTGLPKRGGVILDGLASIGRSASDIRAILLTHSHVDHAGNAAFLKAQSGGQLYCPTLDAPAVRGTAPVPAPTIVSRVPWLLLRPLLGLLPRADAADVDREIGDGFSLTVPEDLRAVATAGHTPGHTSYLLDRAGGILFAGDAASHKRGRVARGWFNAPLPEIEQSVRTLAQLEFAVACFGHADPITSGAAGAFREYAARLG